MRHMLTVLRRKPGEWAEPIDFLAFSPKAKGILVGTSQAIKANLCKIRSCALYTSPRATNVKRFAKTLADAVESEGWGAVVDDGVSAFAVVPYKGAVAWVDPHTRNPKRQRFRPTHLTVRDAWMVLLVPPPF
jgi:hypothetical protein